MGRGGRGGRTCATMIGLKLVFLEDHLVVPGCDGGEVVVRFGYEEGGRGGIDLEQDSRRRGVWSVGGRGWNEGREASSRSVRTLLGTTDPRSVSRRPIRLGSPTQRSKQSTKDQLLLVMRPSYHRKDDDSEGPDVELNSPDQTGPYT